MWYSARLLYESVIDDDVQGDHLWEEKLVVFQCEERNNLPVKLTILAKEGEHEYKNIYDENVTWTFREVLEVQEISGENISDGTEVFYRFWDNPSSGDFEMMRRTQTEPWWLQNEPTEGA